MLTAARRMRGTVRRTPLERSDALSQAAGTDVWLKLETQQRTGSFKLRGALNRIAVLSAEERARGVVAASAGNHGAGVALAAGLHGVAAVVYVPEGAPEVKRRRIARLGAELRTVPGGYDAAHAAALRHAEESGAVYVDPCADPLVVAGQGTVGLEIVEDLPEVRTIVAPAGGGGLIGGIGVVARALGSGIRVVGASTHPTSALKLSVEAGRPVPPPGGETICEGLEGEVDAPAVALARRVVDAVVLVGEDAVRRAVRRLYVDEGVVAEGSAAVAAAALWEGAMGEVEGPVAVVLSGGNLDAARLATILMEG